MDNLTINFYSPCTPLLVPGPNQTRPGNVNSSGLVGGPINTPRNPSGRFDGHIKPAPDDWAVIKGELNVIHPHASCEGASGSKGAYRNVRGTCDHLRVACPQVIASGQPCTQVTRKSIGRTHQISPTSLRTGHLDDYNYFSIITAVRC